MLYEFNHYGIVIRDLGKSLAFYQDVLGGEDRLPRASSRRTGPTSSISRSPAA